MSIHSWLILSRLVFLLEVLDIGIRVTKSIVTAHALCQKKLSGSDHIFRMYVKEIAVLAYL